MTFRKQAPFPFSGKEAPNLVEPLDQANLSHLVPYKKQLVQICTWEQI
jgi:hypothetical protein